MRNLLRAAVALAALTVAAMLYAAEPDVAVFKPFTMPAADGSTIQAMFVPGTESDSVVLVLTDLRSFKLVPYTEPPVPPPPPPPPPPPIDKAVAMYVIVETGPPNPPTPAMVRVRDAKAWRDAADAAKIRWSSADPDAAEEQWPNIVARARAAGLPAVVFLDANGVVSIEPLPATVEAMVALVKAKGGVQ
jgi:hypothetical protein